MNHPAQNTPTTSPSESVIAARHPFTRVVIRIALWGLHGGPLVAVLLLIVVLGIYTAVGFARGVAPPGTAVFRSSSLGRITARIEAFLPHLLLLWAMVGAALAHLAHRFGSQRFRRLTLRSELRLEFWFGRLGLFVCVGLFLFSLTRSWTETTEPVHGRDDSHYSTVHGGDTTRYSALLGFLPWSDAQSYYDGARGLLDTGTLDTWNERRSLNAALFAVRLGLAGLDLRTATILQSMLLALCAFIASQALARRLGIWAAIGAIALILSFGRQYQASTLSESLGISLGALSVGLLYRGIQDRNGYLAAGGLGALALGMSARAGALFAAPALLLTLFFRGRTLWRAHRKALVAALLAVFLGFFWTPVLNRIYGTGSGMAGANFAVTACGLALGGRWTDAQRQYAEQIRSLHSERERALFFYREAFNLVRQDPKPLLTSLFIGEWQFLSEIGPVIGELVLLDIPHGALAVGLGALLLAGILWHFSRRRLPGESSLWLGVWSGLLLSVPFIFRDGDWRALAATWPFLAAFVSVGLSTSHPIWLGISPPKRWDLLRDTAWGCVVLLALAALVGPWAVHAISARPDLKRCKVNDQNGTVLIVRQPLLDPVVEIVSAGQPRPKGVPSVEFERYQQLVTESRMEDSQTLFDAPPRPFVLLWAYDYLSNKSHPVVAPSQLLANRNQWIWLKVERWNRSPYFERVTDYGSWDSCQAGQSLR